MNQEGTDDGREDPAHRLFARLVEYRGTVRAALDDEQHALLISRLRALAEVEPHDGRAVGRALQGVRLALLPLPLDHPVRRALDSLRLAGAAPPGPRTLVRARELTDLLASPPPAPDPDPQSNPESHPEPHPDPDPSPGPDPDPSPGPNLDLESNPDPGRDPEPAFEVTAARRGLLAAPALSADEVRERCGSAPPPPELIRLAGVGDGDRYPEFQFAGDGGSPYPVVLEVNRVLLADIDPWGAAGWWLSGNSWLGGTPAALLGHLPDQELLGAASALVEGEG